MRRVGLLLLIACSCTDDVFVGYLDPESGIAGSAGAAPCLSASCQGATYDCGDCLDNDADGLVDASDPACLGPCDNTEDSLYSGIPGQNEAPCKQDCYYDRDTGSGNDDCGWSLACDPESPSEEPQCAYDAQASIPGTDASCEEARTAQTETCRSVCLPVTPNGCDCFGCCEISPGSGSYVWLGSTLDGAASCDLESLADPDRCKPCTQVAACSNPCDECEVCLGQLEPVATCAESCPSGELPCGLPGQAACAAGSYCITGCCVPLPE